MVRAILVVMLRELFSLKSEQKFPTMQGVICALTAGGELGTRILLGWIANLQIVVEILFIPCYDMTDHKKG